MLLQSAGFHANCGITAMGEARRREAPEPTPTASVPAASIPAASIPVASVASVSSASHAAATSAALAVAYAAIGMDLARRERPGQAVPA